MRALAGALLLASCVLAATEPGSEAVPAAAEIEPQGSLAEHLERTKAIVHADRCWSPDVAVAASEGDEIAILTPSHGTHVTCPEGTTFSMTYSLNVKQSGDKDQTESVELLLDGKLVASMALDYAIEDGPTHTITVIRGPSIDPDRHVHVVEVCAATPPERSRRMQPASPVAGVRRRRADGCAARRRACTTHRRGRSSTTRRCRARRPGAFGPARRRSAVQTPSRAAASRPASGTVRRTMARMPTAVPPLPRKAPDARRAGGSDAERGGGARGQRRTRTRRPARWRRFSRRLRRRQAARPSRLSRTTRTGASRPAGRAALRSGARCGARRRVRSRGARRTCGRRCGRSAQRRAQRWPSSPSWAPGPAPSRPALRRPARAGGGAARAERARARRGRRAFYTWSRLEEAQARARVVLVEWNPLVPHSEGWVAPRDLPPSPDPALQGARPRALAPAPRPCEEPRRTSHARPGGEGGPGAGLRALSQLGTDKGYVLAHASAHTPYTAVFVREDGAARLRASQHLEDPRRTAELVHFVPCRPRGAPPLEGLPWLSYADARAAANAAPPSQGAAWHKQNPRQRPDEL